MQRFQLNSFGETKSRPEGLSLRRRNADPGDIECFPAPFDVSIDNRVLPEVLNVWYCDKQEIWVGQRVYGDYWYTAMTVYVADSQVRNRDLLIDIAQEILPFRAVARELYPSVRRTRDLSCSFLWSGPGQDADYWSDGLKLLKPLTQNRAPGVAIAQGPDGRNLAVIGSRGQRDWGSVQMLKNQYLGAEMEAMDLLLPQTRGLGAHLFYEPYRAAGVVNGGLPALR